MMKLISNTSFNGRLGHIKRDQEFHADDAYAAELIAKKMAREAPNNKAEHASPKNKSAGSDASSSPAGPVSPRKTRTPQKS